MKNYLLTILVLLLVVAAVPVNADLAQLEEDRDGFNHLLARYNALNENLESTCDLITFAEFQAAEADLPSELVTLKESLTRHLGEETDERLVIQWENLIRLTDALIEETENLLSRDVSFYCSEEIDREDLTARWADLWNDLNEDDRRFELNANRYRAAIEIEDYEKYLRLRITLNNLLGDLDEVKSDFEELIDDTREAGLKDEFREDLDNFMAESQELRRSIVALLATEMEDPADATAEEIEERLGNLWDFLEEAEDELEEIEDEYREAIRDEDYDEYLRWRAELADLFDEMEEAEDEFIEIIGLVEEAGLEEMFEEELEEMEEFGEDILEEMEDLWEDTMEEPAGATAEEIEERLENLWDFLEEAEDELEEIEDEYREAIRDEEYDEYLRWRAELADLFDEMVEADDEFIEIIGLVEEAGLEEIFEEELEDVEDVVEDFFEEMEDLWEDIMEEPGAEPTVCEAIAEDTLREGQWMSYRISDEWYSINVRAISDLGEVFLRINDLRFSVIEGDVYDYQPDEEVLLRLVVDRVVHDSTSGDFIEYTIWPALDDCPEADSEEVTDTDSDGVADSTDNCPDDANADQLDTDSDGIGDVCDEAPEEPATLQDQFTALKNQFENYEDNFDEDLEDDYKKALRSGDEGDIEDEEDNLKELRKDLKDLRSLVRALQDEVELNEPENESLLDDIDELIDDINNLREDIKDLLNGESDSSNGISDFEYFSNNQVPERNTQQGNNDVVVQPLQLPDNFNSVQNTQATAWEGLRSLAWVGALMVVLLAVIIFFIALLIK